MSDERPAAESLRSRVFTAEGRLRPGAVKAKLQRVQCGRRQHTVAVALYTLHGWWVAWRRPLDDPDGVGWEVDWADQVVDYTLSTCSCKKVRRVDEIFARLVR